MEKQVTENQTQEVEKTTEDKVNEPKTGGILKMSTPRTQKRKNRKEEYRHRTPFYQKLK